MISLYGIKQWLLFLKNDTSKTIDSLRTKIEHFGSEFFLLCKTFQKKLVMTILYCALDENGSSHFLYNNYYFLALLLLQIEVNV